MEQQEAINGDLAGRVFTFVVGRGRIRPRRTVVTCRRPCGRCRLGANAACSCSLLACSPVCHSLAISVPKIIHPGRSTRLRLGLPAEPDGLCRALGAQIGGTSSTGDHREWCSVNCRVAAQSAFIRGSNHPPTALSVSIVHERDYTTAWGEPSFDDGVGSSPTNTARPCRSRRCHTEADQTDVVPVCMSSRLAPLAVCRTWDTDNRRCG